MIKTTRLSYAIRNKTLVDQVNLNVNCNELVVIMGANGAGKTTLLRLLSGQLQPTMGDVLIEDQSIKNYTVKELALKRAVLSQHYEISFPFSVREIIMMGRYPYFDGKPSAKDEAIVNELIELMQLQGLADRNYQTLSGGEAQKAQMCRVMAQMRGRESDKRYLLLDEPVSHLDIRFQYQLLDTARSMLNPCTAVVAVLHDINLALTYADRILFMKDARILHQYQREESFDVAIIKDVFGMEAQLVATADGKRKWVGF